MANGGTIEIDVELTGTKDTREGFKSISQAGKSMAQSVGSTNEKLAEGIGEIGESVFGLADSLGELKGSFAGIDSTGSASFTALLGPIGAAAAAAFGLYEVFRLITGSALEAEEAQQSMRAAAADLQGKLEALAEKGVVLAANEMQRFTKMTLLAQVAKEKLQFSQEKLTRKTMAFIKAEKDLEKAKKFLNKVQERQIKDARELEAAYTSLRFAQEQVISTEKAFNDAIVKGLKDQKAVSEKIAKAEKDYVGFEEKSPEFLKTKIKENLEKKKTLELTKAESTLTEKQFKLKKIEIEQNITLALLQAEKNKKNQKALLTQNEILEDQLKKLNAVEIANKKAAFQRKQLLKIERDKAIQERKRRITEKENEQKRLLQLEMKTIAERARIQQLIIDNQEDSEEKQIKLATLRYNTALQLAKDNNNQRIIAELAFQNDLKSIRETFQAERDSQDSARLEANKQFAYETAEFNIQQIENEFERENALLALQYAQRLDAAKGNQEQITELNRRFAIERQNLVSRETDVVNQKLSGFFGNMGRGFAEAAVGAIMFGDSFKQATAQLLQTLAKQAGIESLMEFAKAAAFSITAPPLAAAHAKAGTLFAAAALAAGGAASVMGAGGSAGGGSGIGGSVSPSGSPQTSNMIEREQATEQTLVFNVNFSGAVVYDTKKAAEQALADRVTKIMKQQRRGKPRV